jgi:DNA-binding transcriptional ArsR family regulator
VSKKRPGSAELFPTDEPIPPSAMIGRDDDVDAVARGLVGGANLIVAGPRRTGKTSVCDAALAVCSREGCYTASVDLFRIADAAELAETLTLRLLANRAPLRRALGTATARAGRVVEALSTSVAYRARQDLGEDFEVALTVGAARADPHRALGAAWELAERIAAADERRLVLFLDEFQEIAGGLYGDPGTVTRQMRAVFQRSPHVSILFAGSIEHVMRDLFAPSDRALSQFGALHELAPIDPDAWRDGLRARLALDRCTIADSALERLLDASEGHPRATMLVAQQAHTVAIEELRRRLDDATVVAGIARAMRADRLKHEQTLARIRSINRHAQRVAERVARGQPLYEDLNPRTAAGTLERLRDAGVVERGSRRGDWSIGDPLLRRYLAALPG